MRKCEGYIAKEIPMPYAALCKIEGDPIRHIEQLWDEVKKLKEEVKRLKENK
jgi:DNA polymerase/3'-5' exonuclease PolX